MRLAVFDTNVIVSGGIRAGGAPGVLLMEWVLEGRIQLVTSPSVIGEYREVVRRTKFRRYGFPPQWLEFVIEQSLHIPEPPAWAKMGPDASDTPFLSLAGFTGAYLITGNTKHFPKEIRGGVTVLSPSEYLAQLEQSS